MTSRQARRERREAERKSAKLAYKAALTEAKSHPEYEDIQAAALSPLASTAYDTLDRPQPLPKTRAEINRENAQLSTGPRSSGGKATSSGNSLQHGLASGQILIPGEDPAALQALFEDLLLEYQPRNTTEKLLVQQLAHSHWLAHRAIRLQAQCFDGDIDEKRLALLLRYQTAHERTFFKALNCLIRLRAEHPQEQNFTHSSHRKPRSVAGFVSQNHTPQSSADAFTYNFGSENRPAESQSGFVSQTGCPSYLDGVKSA